MKLLGDGPIIDKDKNSTNVLVHCNIVQNNYQQVSKVLYVFVLDKTWSIN